MIKKSTKRKLAMSILSMILCTAMLIGSTYAWFSDTAKTGPVNITAGNLKVGLQVKNAEGAYEDVTESTKLFQDVALWEPGVVTYEEFKVQNLGSMALKYAVYVDDAHMAQYVIAEPNDGTNENYSVEEYPYVIMGKTLGDMLMTAAYPGTYAEFVAAVNEAMELEGDAAYTTDSNDRNRQLIQDAYDSGILAFEYFYGQDIIVGANAWAVGGLLKKGETSDESWAIQMGNDNVSPEEDLIIEHPSDTNEFTLFCWWAPEDIRDDGTFDNGYNIVDGRKVTNITSLESGDKPGLDVIAEAEINEDHWKFDEDNTWFYYVASNAKSDFEERFLTDNPLTIDFQLILFATQVEYESDSFGSNYDKGAWPEPEIIKP